MHLSFLLAVLVAPALTLDVSAGAGVKRHGIQSYESRFTETTLPQVPGPGGIVGDVSPSQFPVINLHMDIPNTDILEEQFLEKERDDMDRELNEVEGDYNRGVNDFFQIAAFQRDQLKKLERLAHLDTALIRGARGRSR